jgi:hypothetical protein
VFGPGIISQDVKVLQQLMYVDSLRGHHSTGLFWLDMNGKSDHYKKALDGPDFLQLAIVDKVFASGTTNMLMMGHNRWATRGGISSETAHPFQCGNITLCHNGTLDTQVGLPDHTKFSVDSENIAHAFDKLGAEAVIPILEGAFALTWWDEGLSTFNMVKNEDRPLCIATSNKRNVTYYASERKMLDAILDRNGIKDVTYHELPVGSWVSVHMDRLKMGKPVIKKMETYVKPAHTSYYGRGTTYNSQRSSNTSLTNSELLTKWGVVAGQKVEFYSSGVEAYGIHQVNGTMHGGTVAGVHCEVRCYNQDRYSLAGIYEGIVTNAQSVQGAEYLVVREPKLIEVFDADGNNTTPEKKTKLAELIASKKT